MINPCRLTPNLNFCVDVFPNVYWIPYRSLGESRYTDNDMHNLYNMFNYKDIIERLNTPYEIIQMLQVNDFKHILDNDITDESGCRREYYKPGRDVLINKAGSCATYSGLFYHICKKSFFDVYNVVILTYPGDGHAMNLIIKDGFNYFCDVHSQLNEYADNVTLETGKKLDFYMSKYKSGCCLKSRSIEDYVKLLNKYGSIRGIKYVFLINQSSIIPTILTSNNESKMNIWLNHEDNWSIVGGIPNNICVYDQNNMNYNTFEYEGMIND